MRRSEILQKFFGRKEALSGTSGFRERPEMIGFGFGLPDFFRVQQISGDEESFFTFASIFHQRRKIFSFKAKKCSLWFLPLPSPSLPLFFFLSFSPTLFLTLALPVSVLSFISHSFSLTHSLSHSYPNSIHFFLFFFLLLFLSSLISLTFFFPLFLPLTISPFLSHSLPFSQQNENEEENLNTSPTKVSPNEKKMFFHQSQKFEKNWNSASLSLIRKFLVCHKKQVVTELKN